MLVRLFELILQDQPQKRANDDHKGIEIRSNHNGMEYNTFEHLSQGNRMQNIILAAGLSSRSEGKKLLLPYKGEPIVAVAVKASLEAGLDTIVVTGYQHEMIEQQIAGYQSDKLKIVINDQYVQGQGSSTICGVSHLNAQESFFISLADMPLIEARHYAFLMEFEEHAVVRPCYKGRLGHPVMLQPSFIPIIKSQKPSFTMRSLLSAYPIFRVVVDEQAYIQDVDTLAEYQKVLTLTGQPPGSPCR